jgi:hypothetical protein
MSAFLRRRYRHWGMLAGCSAVILAASFTVNPAASLLAHVAPAVIFALVSLTVIRIHHRQLVRRVAEGQTLLYRPFSSRIDDTGFATVTDRDRQDRHWSDFSDWFEVDDYFVLIEAGSIVRIIPKRFLQEQIEEARTIFMQRISSRQS